MTFTQLAPLMSVVAVVVTLWVLRLIWKTD
jgi:hypothetical protein